MQPPSLLSSLSEITESQEPEPEAPQPVRCLLALHQPALPLRRGDDDATWT